MKEVYYANVLKSKGFNYFYKGHCSNLKKRLKQHNSGMTRSTRPYIPFEIVYFEEFETLQEAIKRERYFKTSRGRKFLKEKLAQ
ncbi:GIY-YIG nuclease family protein [uncultured Algoriphagus sp.]|uniref:GIY-YIG nuclease family protein n=1 Tax=uncultured Algoriphagus sp. TaxID=417365 RepID=UPI00259675FD|nr:GIY-YIG nuclease family protein [uncultured Algoriphagus sp.]